MPFSVAIAVAFALLAVVVVAGFGGAEVAGSGPGIGIGSRVKQSRVKWSGVSVSGLMLRSSRQKCEYASLVYFCAFRQFSFICQRVSLPPSPSLPLYRAPYLAPGLGQKAIRKMRK